MPLPVHFFDNDNDATKCSKLYSETTPYRSLFHSQFWKLTTPFPPDGDSHMKWSGMLVEPFRGQNLEFWYRSGCWTSESNIFVLKVPLRGSGVSEVNFRDKMKPLLRNVRFRFRILQLLVPFRGQKSLNQALLVPLRGQEKNSRLASPTFSYGSPHLTPPHHTPAHPTPPQTTISSITSNGKQKSSIYPERSWWTIPDIKSEAEECPLALLKWCKPTTQYSNLRRSLLHIDLHNGYRRATTLQARKSWRVFLLFYCLRIYWQMPTCTCDVMLLFCGIVLVFVCPSFNITTASE